ncbi:MAG: DUF3592 domain-containing protein [Chthoniobacterales bacterium]
MLALIFFIAFPFLLWKAWQTHQTAKASAAWPTTEGTITKVERFKRLFRSLPRVAYTYSVGEKNYASERISFVAGYRPKEVDEVLSRYTVGQTVPVYYPPERPTEAVLQPGSNKQVTAPIRMLAICFVLLVLLNVAQFILKNAEERENPRRPENSASDR